VPTGADRPSLNELRSDLNDPTLLIYASLKPRARGGRAEIVWAEYAKPVTFELSEFERWAQQALQKSNARGREPHVQFEAPDSSLPSE
jgi:hypothetical protein